MKNIAKAAALSTIISALTGIMFTFSQAMAAGTATLSLIPASGTYVVGNTVSVNIYEDSGSDSVQAVQADFTYPSNLLSFVGITDSAAFSVDAQNSVSGGTAKIARGTFSSVTGSQLVATVKFTATAAGTANLVFSGTSGVASGGSYETLTTYNAAYTINNPATPNTGGTSTPPSTTKTTTKTTTTTPPSSNSQPTQTPATPAPDTTPPAISAVNTSDLTDHSVTITWETSEPATSEVDLGFSDKYIVTQVDSTLTKSHKVVVDPKYLTPGATYHYKVKSTDQAGNLAFSKDLTFKTTAAEAPAKPKSNNFWAAFAAIVIIAAVALGGATYIRRMKGRMGGPSVTTAGSSGSSASHSADIKPKATVSSQAEVPAKSQNPTNGTTIHPNS